MSARDFLKEFEQTVKLTDLVEQEFKDQDVLRKIGSSETFSTSELRKIGAFEDKSPDHKLSMSLYLINHTHPVRVVLFDSAIANVKNVILQKISEGGSADISTTMKTIEETMAALSVDRNSKNISGLFEFLDKMHTDASDSREITDRLIASMRGSQGSAPDPL